MKRPRMIRPIATKKPRTPALSHPGAANDTNTTATNTASLLQTRPWLRRPQQISEQDLWILHHRDNLIPGATGPQDWHVLAAEFNKRFEDELKKPLAYNTLSKRCGVARKTFLKTNPEYARVCVYPVPEAEAETEEESEDVEMTDSEESVDQTDSQEQGLWYPPNLDNTNMFHEHIPNLAQWQTIATPADSLEQETPSERASYSRVNTPIPGSFNPSTVQDNYIPPTTRAKFHLQHRTNKPVTFHFFDPHEEILMRDDPQYIDADILKFISPSYSRKALRSPESGVINLPEHTGPRTVNIFIQLVSPERAIELPTHYLWKAKAPVPGVFDRFGAIHVEKIAWTVDALLELLLLAQWMEVYWIIDMVIDRMHYLFTQQARYKALFAAIGKSPRGCDGVGGQQVLVGSQLPPVDNTFASIAPEDFDAETLTRFVKFFVETPVWRFVADMIYALGGEAEGGEWVTAISGDVQYAFSHVEKRYLDADTTRQDFCKRYHHHASGPNACYTSHPIHSANYIIDTLYASSYPQRENGLSDELASRGSLVDSIYSSIGVVSRLNNGNLTRPMVALEKMILEMETRLHEAKNAMWRALKASDEEEGEAATDEVRRAVLSMYSQTRCSVTDS
ncbi:hypothetical protein ACET3X_000590 [Alternaria dauci]|uniref:Clr5 domain-containing protein n=1 Tax=Alternaria dauci TaxID=48095 RepID=A0ABR3UVZ3_9PLEO